MYSNKQKGTRPLTLHLPLKTHVGFMRTGDVVDMTGLIFEQEVQWHGRPVRSHCICRELPRTYLKHLTVNGTLYTHYLTHPQPPFQFSPLLSTTNPFPDTWFLKIR